MQLSAHVLEDSDLIHLKLLGRIVRASIVSELRDLALRLVLGVIVLVVCAVAAVGITSSSMAALRWPFARLGRHYASKTVQGAHSAFDNRLAMGVDVHVLWFGLLSWKNLDALDCLLDGWLAESNGLRHEASPLSTALGDRQSSSVILLGALVCLELEAGLVAGDELLQHATGRPVGNVVHRDIINLVIGFTSVQLHLLFGSLVRLLLQRHSVPVGPVSISQKVRLELALTLIASPLRL